MKFQITVEDLIKANLKIGAILKEEHVGEIKNSIKRKNLTYERLAKKVGYTENFIFLILNKERNPRLALMKKLENILDINLNKHVSSITSILCPGGTHIPISSFPIKSTPELASLMGHSLGDGHVGATFSYTNKCEELIKDTINSAKSLPVRNLTMNEWYHRGKTIRFSALIRDILVAAGSTKGNKTKQPCYIPKWIMGGTSEIKGRFLQALFDDEGTVSIKKKQITLPLSKSVRLEGNLDIFLKI